MRVVAQNPWAWTLFHDDVAGYVLSALCGTVGLYGLEIALSPSEVREYELGGLAGIEVLAKKMSAEPAAYKGRAIDGFLRTMEARSAIDAWKSEPDQTR